MIFAAIGITAVITALAFMVLALRSFALSKIDELREKRDECRRLRKKLDDCLDWEIRQLERKAYQEGLYDGRKTDTAYRELLRRMRSEDYDKRLYEMIGGDGDDK